MFGLLSQKGYQNAIPIFTDGGDIGVGYGGYGGYGGDYSGSSAGGYGSGFVGYSAPLQSVSSSISSPSIISSSSAISNYVSSPTQDFDLSVLKNLKAKDKYLGKNRVSDILEAYQTYITDTPVGRGGQYAVDSAKKYGVSIREAARGYLQGVGLPTLQTSPTQTTTQDTTQTTVQEKNPFEILADILPSLFGGAVYNPPLQSQAYGYTPAESNQPLTQQGGKLNIGLLVIIAVIGVIGYFLYKRFAN